MINDCKELMIVYWYIGYHNEVHILKTRGSFYSRK